MLIKGTTDIRKMMINALTYWKSFNSLGLVTLHGMKDLDQPWFKQRTVQRRNHYLTSKRHYSYDKSDAFVKISE